MITIYNENCLQGMKKIADNSVDLILTDPPYKLTGRGNIGNSGGMFKKKSVKSGRLFNSEIDCSEYAPEFYRVLKDSGHCYIMTNHVNLIEFLNVFTGCGFRFVKSLVWDKQRKIMGQYYMSQFEYILFFRKGKGVKINNCGTSDLLSVPIKKSRNALGENLHDTEKPVELMKILAENSSKKGETVLDPFMGIGSTAIACAALERDFIGFEIDANYFETAKNRIEKCAEYSTAKP